MVILNLIKKNARWCPLSPPSQHCPTLAHRHVSSSSTTIHLNRNVTMVPVWNYHHRQNHPCPIIVKILQMSPWWPSSINNTLVLVQPKLRWKRSQNIRCERPRVSTLRTPTCGNMTRLLREVKITITWHGCLETRLLRHTDTNADTAAQRHRPA